MKENIIVAFSGGRTSGFMCWWLITYMSHLYNLFFVYANTGLEHEKTLEFVDKCDKYFGLNLVWLEAIVSHDERKGSGAKVVNFETASRKGEPFEEVIKKYGLVNMDFFHCTRDLKQRVITSYFRDNLNMGNPRRALGIRFDEFHRVKNDPVTIFPLATITKITKQEILDWWKLQPFDLEIEEHYGNCVGCYKKSDKKLQMIASENPHYFDFFVDMENKYSSLKSKNEDTPRKIYRHFRTAYEVQNDLNLPKTMQDIEDCAEECGSIMSEYKSIVVKNRLF